jgi:hypothetical protein
MMGYPWNLEPLKVMVMETLPLFDDPTLTTTPEKNVLPAADLDVDLHQEKFGFARDQRRLKTLHHYLEKP